MRGWSGLIAMALLALSTGAQAQISTGNDAGGGGQAAPFSNVTTSFDGISVNVRRLVADPTADGAVRLIFQLSNTADKDRRILFTGPRTTLIDELGNVLVATETVGIEACMNYGDWPTDMGWCGRNRGAIATRLAPNVPVTVAVKFVPGSGYSKELAELSNTASLRSRIAHYANDLSDGKTADIIINDLPFPR